MNVAISQPHMQIVALLVFNAPVFLVAFRVPITRKLCESLRSKGPPGSPVDSTSYSRVTGMFGAVVLTAFFWALGNVVVWMALSDKPETIGTLLANVQWFFLAGSALFLPYAFNQLSSIYTPPIVAVPVAPAPVPERALSPAIVLPEGHADARR
jgi:hypothetical protein